MSEGEKATRRRQLGCVWALAFLVWSGPLGGQQGTGGGEWPSYAGDSGSTKYSPLDQIDRENVRELQIAWSWTVPDAAIAEGNALLERATYFEATPLMIGGALYVTTPLSQLAAIDAVSGQSLWVYDPKSWKHGRPTNLGFVNRGAAYWTDGEEARLFFGTGDGHLVAVDPKTGKPEADFGEGGKVDLTEGLGRRVRRRTYAVSSAPVVCRNVVIVGASISDGATRRKNAPGHVRGFDVRTGATRWIFHTIPQEREFGNDTWEDGSWRYSGNTNVWAPLSADEALGYVYLPISTPTNDWYGGQRLGDNLFAESLVCLECASGKRVWHFQMVHHGLWDYDLPAAPNLVDLVVEGKEIRAVAQVSKQGFSYVFDRRTGDPVWPIEERPVPQSDVPGEKTSPTQPFPTKPPPFERQGITVDDLIDFTPELRAAAVEIIQQFKSGPLFTPPSLGGTIQLPGYGGGANWGGAAFDPETGILYVPSITSPLLVVLGEPDAARSDFRYIRHSMPDFGGPQGLPLTKPPYARITAIDLNRGEILWLVPNGDGPRDHPLLEHLDLLPLGSKGRAAPLLTKTLLFLGEGAGRTSSTRGGGGPQFRAYDKATGEVL